MRKRNLIRLSITSILLLSVVISSSLVTTTFARSSSYKNSTKIRHILDKDFKNTKKIQSNSEITVFNDDLSKKNDYDNVITMVDEDNFIQLDEAKKSKVKDELKKDYNNNKCIVLYSKPDNNKSQSDIYKILDIQGAISTPADDIAKENEKRLIAYSILKTSDGTINTNSYYAEAGSDLTDINKNLSFIVDGYKESLGKHDSFVNDVDTKSTVKPQTVTNGPTFIDSKTYNFGTSGNLACGTFQMTTAIDRIQKYSDKSLWDVKGSNTTTSAYHTSSSWYITDELATRYSVDGHSGEKVIQNGLNTTNSGNSYNVSLNAGYETAYGSVGWSGTFNDVDCIADYHPLTTGGYARWIFDYYRGIFGVPNPASYSYTTEPGARYQNTVGAFYIDVSCVATYWSKDNGSIRNGYTGVVTYALSDR